ncbi:hypothetical protein MIR68_003290 [Amoeboaphelidium protococcarum]|nr:hypothetical protein MIR68_003290 [Amoeboaphelidium protococcarum]
MAEHLSFTMAGLCSFGGLAGYISKRSKPSLFAGVGIGLAYAYTGYMFQQGSDYGHEAALVVSLLLTGAMLPRGLRTRKMMPLIVGTLGALNTVYHIKRIYDFKFA